MPIKFRCHHCRQFLGISRAKAGEVVDCPTCGRTIRVPELDGTVKPLPKPGLNIKDSQLAKALHELAAIGDDVPDEQPRVRAPSADRQPEPRLRVVDIAPLPNPEPVEVEVKQSLDPSVESEDRPWISTAAPGDEWKKLLAAAAATDDDDSEDEPVKVREPGFEVEAASAGTNSGNVSVANSADVVATPGSVMPSLNERSESISAEASVLLTRSSHGDVSLRLTRTVHLALAGILALVFAVGFWAGRVTAIRSQSSSESPQAEVTPAAQPDPFAGQEPSEQRSAALKGRITFTTPAGDRRPDRAARILVLPEQRAGSTKIAADGLRADAPATDRQLALIALRTLGGDFTTTDEEGQFEITLASAGQYQILVFSNSLSREDGATMEVDAALSPFFDRPAQLYGRVRFHLDSFRYSGGGVTPWDYSFSR